MWLRGSSELKAVYFFQHVIKNLLSVFTDTIGIYRYYYIIYPLFVYNGKTFGSEI